MNRLLPVLTVKSVLLFLKIFQLLTNLCVKQSFKSMTILNDEESNDGVLIVDDRSSPTPSRASSASDLQSPLGFISRRGSGRGRGRPRGSRARGPMAVRGRGCLTSAALAAAELAGAQAGKSAALAAYPFLGSGLDSDNVVPTFIQKRGRGRGRSKTLVLSRTISATKTQTISDLRETQLPQTSQLSDSTAHASSVYEYKE